MNELNELTVAEGGDAVTQVAELATRAAGLTLHEIEGDPTRVVLAQDGSHEEIHLPPPPRCHEVTNVVDLVAAADRYAAGSIWIDDQRITAILIDEHDDLDRRSGDDRVVMPLVAAAPYLSLRALGEGMEFQQRAMARWLKFDMADCLDDSFNDLPRRIACMKFERTESGERRIAQGEDSLGKTVHAVARSAEGDLPEIITVTIPVFANHGETGKWTARLSLDVRPETGTMYVAPLPGELDRIHSLALAAIKKELGGMLAKTKKCSDVPVFVGRFD